MNSSRFLPCLSPLPLGEGRVRAMNMSNTLGYLRGELGKERGKKKEVLARRVLELSPVKKMLLAVYNKIFSWYYS